jgi:HD-GYP domain-containing protein (c-di-GMP phosphodiesterase class II)
MFNPDQVHFNQPYQETGEKECMNRRSHASVSRPVKTDLEVRREAQNIYFSAIKTVHEVFKSYAQNRHVKLDGVKSFIQTLLNQPPDNEDIYLSLTSLQGSEDYLFQHLVNVCILSVALGNRLGLENDRLSELAFAAIFHDFGKSAILQTNLSNSEELSRKELELIENHTVLGAKYLARDFKLDRFSSHAAIVAFEHHKNCDGSGFPFVNKKRAMSLYSRIVAICNFYDEMTTGRTIQKVTITFDQVLLKMIQHASAKFDPYLMKVFLNLVGLYPIGTLLLLDNSELVMVIRNNPEDLFRPEVMILADEKGRKNPVSSADLSSFDKSNNRYFRNILHLVDPLKYGIDISEFLLSE